MLWKHCHKGTAKMIHRKSGQLEERILRTLHWFSTTCLENSWSGLGVNPVNTMFWFNLFFRVYVVMVWLSKMGKYSSQKILWVFICQEWGREVGAQSEKGHVCSSRRCWEVCGKERVRVSGFAQYCPVLLTRTWDVQGKRWHQGVQATAPQLLCWVPTACHVSLGDGNENEGVISWFPAAENNKCFVTNTCDSSYS